MTDKSDAIPETINFDFVKSSQFRVIHADGAFIGLTQTGLTVNFFTERQPIPRRVVHKVGKDGAIGEEIMEQRVVRDAIVRDAEVSILMNMDVAKRVIEALQTIIQKRDEATAKQGKGQ
jgi:hypothetical protein